MASAASSAHLSPVPSATLPSSLLACASLAGLPVAAFGRRRQAACRAKRPSRLFSRRRCWSRESILPCRSTSSSWISLVAATSAATSRFSLAKLTPRGGPTLPALRPCSISWNDFSSFCAGPPDFAAAAARLPGPGKRSCMWCLRTSFMSQTAASLETTASVGCTALPPCSFPRGRRRSTMRRLSGSPCVGCEGSVAITSTKPTARPWAGAATKATSSTAWMLSPTST
mmetsp:Transcript_103735/g.302771  ORF Transcript_103735/g.302771 Transcript_103735/m.302771 type:complete len:228 (-) Transcript_103735:972-1655(-)